MGNPGGEVDYLSINGSFYIAHGGVVVDLRNADVYWQSDVLRQYPGYTTKPGVALVAGKTIGSTTDDQVKAYLSGASGSATFFAPAPVFPLVGVGGGSARFYGEKTSVELGISIPPGGSISPGEYGVRLGNEREGR